MSSQPFDIERCLHALGGHATPDRDASSQAGRLMRGLMLEGQAQTSVLEDGRNVALMARLRAAGAFKGSGRRRPLGWLAAWCGKPAALGLLSLASVATLFVMLRPAEAPVDDGVEVMRGAEQAQHLQVADPAAFADELQGLLQARQLLVRRVDSAGSATIQLQAKLPDDGQLRQDLSVRGVQVPAHGRLSLLIERLPAGDPPKPAR